MPTLELPEVVTAALLGFERAWASRRDDTPLEALPLLWAALDTHHPEEPALLSELERALPTLLSLAASPASGLEITSQHLPLERARRPSPRAALDLASRPSRWQGLTPQGPLPAELLCEVPQHSLDLYENRALAALLRRVRHHLRSQRWRLAIHCAQMETFTTPLFDGWTYHRFREERLARLWRHHPPTPQDDSQARELLRRVESLLAAVELACHRPVARLAPLPAGALLPTHLLRFDPRYQRVAGLWAALDRAAISPGPRVDPEAITRAHLGWLTCALRVAAGWLHGPHPGGAGGPWSVEVEPVPTRGWVKVTLARAPSPRRSATLLFQAVGGQPLPADPASPAYEVWPLDPGGPADGAWAPWSLRGGPLVAGPTDLMALERLQRVLLGHTTGVELSEGRGLSACPVCDAPSDAAQVEGRCGRCGSWWGVRRCEGCGLGVPRLDATTYHPPRGEPALGPLARARELRAGRDVLSTPCMTRNVPRSGLLNVICPGCGRCPAGEGERQSCLRCSG